jgi:hypothetical protein
MDNEHHNHYQQLLKLKLLISVEWEQPLTLPFIEEQIKNTIKKTLYSKVNEIKDIQIPNITYPPSNFPIGIEGGLPPIINGSRY